jgi:hypothetical protein
MFRRIVNFFGGLKNPLTVEDIENGLENGLEEGYSEYDIEEIAKNIIASHSQEQRIDINTCIKDTQTALMFNKLEKAKEIDPIILTMLADESINSVEKLKYINKFDDISRQGANMMEKSREWVYERIITYYELLLDDSIERRHFESVLLCSHRVLKSNFIEPIKRQIIINYFEDLLNNGATPHNTKAEIADLFTKLRDERLVELGRRWIQILGTRNGQGRKTMLANIYVHGQNVHSTGIESSAMKTLLNFGQSSVDITPYEAIKQIRRKYSMNINVSKSLDRILIDTAQFSANNMRLRDVLNHVWSRIQKHPEQDELYKRLGQELEDSTGVCSTGYLTRLVNVLATYDKDVVIAFSYADEIYASLRSRILALAEKELPSVMDGLCLTYDPKDAIEFIARIRENLRRELQIEYRDVISSGKLENFNTVFDESLHKFFTF